MVIQVCQGEMEILELRLIKDHRDLKGSEDKLATGVKKVNKVLQETWALLDSRVRKVTRALLESQEDQDLSGPLEERATLEYLANQAPRVTLALQESWEAKGRRVKRESKDLRAG